MIVLPATAIRDVRYKDEELIYLTASSQANIIKMVKKAIYTERRT
jgi:hypothetical protein